MGYKFKAWNESLNKLFNVVCIDFLTKKLIVSCEDEENNSGWMNLYDFVLFQFTGISDANDIDVYVGDLFEVTLLEFGIKNPIKIIGEVVSFRCCYMIKYTNQNKVRYSDLYDFIDGNEKYIKGNIRKNSDLLS